MQPLLRHRRVATRVRKERDDAGRTKFRPTTAAVLARNMCEYDGGLCGMHRKLADRTRETCGAWLYDRLIPRGGGCVLIVRLWLRSVNMWLRLQGSFDAAVTAAM